ncbi:MAG TPA: ABC transporter ATP-binding protein [Clostridia bacterium]|nr:ABC transporter ATP-binding protein [Clostridia bacterium]
MSNCFIDMKDLSLYYPSAPYNAKSLKELIFGIVKRKQTSIIIKDVQALKNISLHIEEGDRLGVIGANGSGKSTLLKAIAGIYPPVSGTLKTMGTIRSLFELSLGFDLHGTGRENILYRSYLLGDTPRTVKSKMQDIIEFADLGEFIDYPIKTYSAGMQMRLAFAISTTVSGDILLLDEAIGAGDAAFMVKVKNRVNEMVANSKILVLVSHDFETVKQICNRVIWLGHGNIIMDGKPNDVVESYLEKAYGKKAL